MNALRAPVLFSSSSSSSSSSSPWTCRAALGVHDRRAHVTNDFAGRYRRGRRYSSFLVITRIISRNLAQGAVKLCADRRACRVRAGYPRHGCTRYNVSVHLYYDINHVVRDIPVTMYTRHYSRETNGERRQDYSRNI